MSVDGAEKEEDQQPPAPVASEQAQVEEPKPVVSEEVAERHRMIKDLGRREITFLKKLVSDYPGFSGLKPGGQLDRMILVLQSACGYGAVSLRIVGQIQEHLNWGKDFDIEDHFRTSSYESEEASGEQTRYRESFEGAFALKREYMNVLANEGEDKPKNEPIRKTVVKKVEAATAPAPAKKMKPIKKTSTAKAQTAPKSAAVPEKTEASVTPIRPEASSESQNEKTDSVRESASGSESFPQWMLIAGVGIVVSIVVASLVIFG